MIALPLTRAAMAGSTSAAPGVKSSTRPPWLDTTMAAAPAATAASASSTVITPLTMNGSRVAAITSCSSAGVLGPTGWPFMAMVTRPAPSTSMPVATRPASSAVRRWSLIMSWVRGLMMAMEAPLLALPALMPLPNMVGSAPSPVMHRVPAWSAPATISAMKSSSVILPPML